LRTEGESDTAHDEKLAALEKAGHPVVRIVLKSIDHIGQEFFRFELATAVAGAVIGINPFNQPDVEAAKIKTRELTAAFEKSGKLPAEKPVMSSDQADIYTDAKNAADLRKAGADGDLGSWLKAHLGRSHAGDYVALLAYIERNAAHIDNLQSMRLAVRDKRRVATCAEFGRASCIRPARPTRAAPIAAYSSRSHPTAPGISPCLARRQALESSRPRRGAEISTCLPNAAVGRYTCI